MTLAALLLSIVLQPVAGGLDRPVQVVTARDGSGTLYIAQQGGKILALENGALRTYLDLTPLVTCCENGGLLSIAFHPLQKDLFALYADRNGDTVLARFSGGVQRILFTVDQPLDNVPNHHGGDLQFGPDGMLYVSIGDGGAYVAVTNRAQELHHFMGKLLRIDVDRGDPYAIPADNPYGEIWSYGLRNPWRFSFDRDTHELLLGDVGQDRYEEVNMSSIAAARGANFGWPIMEGAHCFQPLCNPAGLTRPRYEYSRANGNCSVTGGYRYRGSRWPSLDGVYLYGDWCSGTLFGDGRPLAHTGKAIVSFGEDDDGELLLVDYNGGLYRITAPVKRRAAGR